MNIEKPVRITPTEHRKTDEMKIVATAEAKYNSEDEVTTGMGLYELGKIGAQLEEVINSDSDLSLHMDPYAEGGFTAQLVEIPENQRPTEVEPNLHPVLIRQNQAGESNWETYGMLIYWADDDEVAEVFPIVPTNSQEKRKFQEELRPDNSDGSSELTLENHRMIYGLWIAAEGTEDFEHLDKLMAAFFPYDSLNLEKAELSDLFGISRSYAEQKLDRILGFWIQRQIGGAISKRIESDTKLEEGVNIEEINLGLNTLTGAKEIMEEALGLTSYEERVSNKIWKGVVGDILAGYKKYDDEQRTKGNQEVEVSGMKVPLAEIDLKAEENFSEAATFLAERYPKILKEVYQEREEIRSWLQGDEYEYLRGVDYFDTTESELS